MIAWINDDYGDGVISRKFYGGNIPEDQITIASKLRIEIAKKVGTYNSYKDALINPKGYNQDIVNNARRLGSVAVQTQWIEGDIKTAESSFFNINQQAVPINQTEIQLLKSRHKPNCIASRAIMRRGEGHKYWAGFSSNKQDMIEQIAKEIHDMLFLPKMQTPIKTLDIPICGKKNISVLSVIYDLVNLSNDIEDSATIPDDVNGDGTINVLKKTRKIVRLINSNDISSFGLHPIIYFYSINGSFRVASFYATVLFVKKMDLDINLKMDFTKVRRSFEDVLYNSADVIQQIFRKHRSAKKGLSSVVLFYFCIIRELNRGNLPQNIIEEIRKDKEFSYLPPFEYSSEISAKEFSSNKKSEIFIRTAIQDAPRCKICNGLLHVNSISIDHIMRIRDGGLGNTSNGQLTHPFCNSGYKC